MLLLYTMNTISKDIDISKSVVQPKVKLGKRSSNARRVAEKVIEQVENGSKVNLSKAIRETGYSEAVATQPQKVTKQAEYKEYIESWTSKLLAVRNKAIEALKNRDMEKEKLRDVTEVVKVTDHSTALALGKSTENVAHKGDVVVFGSDDFLARQIQNGSVKPN